MSKVYGKTRLYITDLVRKVPLAIGRAVNENSESLQISVLHENKINESPREKGIIPHRKVRHRPMRQLPSLMNNLGHQFPEVTNVIPKPPFPF